MGAAELDVEVAEVAVFECGGATAEAVGFDVAAERDSGFGICLSVHWRFKRKKGRGMRPFSIPHF